MPDFTRDDWRNIPNAIIEQDKRQTAAQEWGTQARSQLATQWGDAARDELAQQFPDLAPASTTPDLAASPPSAAGAPLPDSSPAPVAPPTALGTESPAAPTLSPPSSARGPINDVSQFGQQGLSYDEALAACGPAAAVRLASMYGNSIPLKAALDAAKQVGWTSAGGMNGIGNQKRLLDNLGIPATIDFNPDLGKMISDATSGNPVTLSTPNHYFTLAGYNPDTKQFNVGQSGLAFRGGSAWMTLDQIKRLGGGINGALYVDAPTSPTPSVAALETGQTQNYTPGDSGTTRTANEYSPTASPTAPPGAAAATQSPGDFQSIVQQAQQAVGGAADAVGGAAAAAGGAVRPKFDDAVTAARQAVGYVGDRVSQGASTLASGQESVGRGSTQAADVATQGAGQGLGEFATGTSPVSPSSVMSGVEQAAGNAVRPAVDAFASSGANQFRRENFPNFTEPGHPLNPETPLDTPGAAFAFGGMAGPVNAAAAAKYQSVMPAGTFESTAAKASALPPSGQLDRVTGWIAQHFTDRDVSLSRIQQQYQRALGRPLNADEMAYELKRLASDPAAAQKIDEGLKPAIQSVGNDYEALRDYVTLRSNVQVAEGAGAKVQAAGMARDVPSTLTADLNAANTSLRMRENALNDLQNMSVPDQARIQLAQRAVNAANRQIQRAEDVINTWQQANTQAASTAGAEAALNRKFSGGLTRDESQARMAQLEQQLSPDRFQNVQSAADQVSQFSKDLRQRLVDSGVLTQDQAAEFERLYPDWAKTRVLDYMKDSAGGQAAGTKIGLSDRGLREYSVQGTEKAREDPLASMVAYAHQAERMAFKNETFNALRTIDQASPAPMLRKVAQDFTPTKDQVTIVGFENGEKVKYVTNNKALGEAINGTSILPVPEWTKAWGQVFRSLATSRNPLFLAGNAALDIPTYVIRESVRAGGPQHLPEILGQLARGYSDAFQGLLQGEFRGANTARFLKGGGGQSGYFTGAEGQASKTVADLRRSNVFQINSQGDLLRIARDLATLQPVESIGERIELGPRVASMRLAETRGANPTQAVINGRTVTVDFSQGGDVTKYINNFIPFFNVGFQGPAQVARAFKENPGAFAWTAGTLLGGPAIAAEAWNRADPKRAQDYADVPQYVKDQGVVVMLPGEAPTDAQGNRKPLYAVLKLREWAPFASLARDAAARVLGDDTKSWQDVAGSALKGFSPSQASSVGQLGTEALAGIPVLPAAAEIQYNKDFFRNRDIVTKRADDSASSAAKALTPAIQAAVDKLGLNVEIRPSAVEFFIRNQGAGVGAAALGASDLAAGKARQDTSPTSLPGVGGLVGRFVGNQTGEGLQNARDEALTPSAREILRSNGVKVTPAPVTGSISGVPLRLDEETHYQQLTNRYVDDAIHAAPQSKDWAKKSQEYKDAYLNAVISAARERAGAVVLQSLPQAEMRRRLAAKSAAPSAPAVAGPTR